MIIEPGWLQTLQLFIRIILILLTCNLVGGSFKSDEKNSLSFFMMILGMGAGLITMVTGSVFDNVPGGVGVIVLISIFLGISLMAAGTILKAETSQKGYKNGAGVWISGILGIAIGSGYYLAAILVAAITYLVLNKIDTTYSVS